MQITWKMTKEFIRKDLYRNLESCSKKDVVKAFCSRNSTTGLLVYYRICHYFAGLKKGMLCSFCFIRFAISVSCTCRRDAALK